MSLSIKIHMNSLGCAKNLVNSEQMLALLRQAGMEVVEDLAQADVAIVNTCGFIDAAKQEAIDTILETAQWKQQGQLKALIATGCLVERYQDEILQELPELDAVCGTGSYTDIVEAVQQALAGQKRAYLASSAQAALEGDRQLITKPYSAFLRIAEGCNNHCSYCIIPSLRGPFRSRTLEHIWQEARQLAAQGAKELLVIAQDTTRYGTDLYGRRALPELVEGLCQIEGVEWIRLHYLYPDELDDALLDVMERNPKVVRYFDIPLQHINDRVLKAMNRRGDSALIKERINTIRSRFPEAVIRTSLIVGFPGETEEEFDELYRFLDEYKLERAGVFAYSQEEGTVAGAMPDQIPEEEKERRREILVELQDAVMDEFSQKLVGTTQRVLCCGYDPEHEMFYGRTYMDSPDVDGIVYFYADEPVEEGTFVPVKIENAVSAELFGEIAQGPDEEMDQ
ncbi:MAG TPA: 30S ribosomal protein S12 methylthiotransferase RimO [Firmicutes bacterium]|nr:30S ribosomal protein S12 methylthiotransferase RimO [Bacillota bacterium]